MTRSERIMARVAVIFWLPQLCWFALTAQWRALNHSLWILGISLVGGYAVIVIAWRVEEKRKRRRELS